MDKEFVTRSITGALCVFLFLFIWCYASQNAIDGVHVCLLTIVLYEWSFFVIRKPSLFFLTLLYPIMPLATLIALNHTPERFLLAIIYIVAFAHDTAAYIIGRSCGKHRIAACISPGKTWQGFFGGCLSVYGATLLVAYLSYLDAFLVSGLASFIATAGDLFESYLKRQVGFKDSGALLPGHGGFLDRLDSILFLAPIVFVMRKTVSAWLFKGI